MALKQNSAEGGTSGAAITASSQTAGASGDQLTRAGSATTLEFSSAHPAHGTLGYHYTYASGSSATLYWGSYNASSMALRSYRYFTALPSTTVALMAVYNSGGIAVVVYMRSNGSIYVQDNGGTLVFDSGSSLLAAGSLYRLELVVIVGASTTNGTVNFATYAADATSPLTAFSMSGQTTTANTGTSVLTSAQFGKLIGTTAVYDDYMDDLAVNDGATTFIGPAASSAPTANAGGTIANGEPWSTLTLTGTDADSGATIVTRTWRQISGVAVVLSGSGASRTYAAPATLAGSTLQFGYRVTDSNGVISPESMVTHTILAVTERAVIGGVEVPLRVQVLTNGTLS